LTCAFSYPPDSSNSAGRSQPACLNRRFSSQFGLATDTLDFLAPSIYYSLCRDVVKLYSVRRHSGDVARIRDTAPVNCRGFVISEVRHAKKPQRRAPRRPRSPFRPLQSPSLALNPATKACHGRPCRPRGRINVRDEIGSRASGSTLTFLSPV
jgi:hypothetical protein